MKTFEGTFTIKWFKNDSFGDRRLLTIDCDSSKELSGITDRLKNDFMTKGENGKLPHSVNIDISERI